jgi:hypothetical protein
METFAGKSNIYSEQRDANGKKRNGFLRIRVTLIERALMRAMDEDSLLLIIPVISFFLFIVFRDDRLVGH